MVLSRTCLSIVRRSRFITDVAAVPLGREVPPESWVASTQGVAPSGVARVHVAVRL